MVNLPHELFIFLKFVFNPWILIGFIFIIIINKQRVISDDKDSYLDNFICRPTFNPSTGVITEWK